MLEYSWILIVTIILDDIINSLVFFETLLVIYTILVTLL